MFFIPELVDSFSSFVDLLYLNRLHANNNFNCALRNVVTGACETQRIACLVGG